MVAGADGRMPFSGASAIARHTFKTEGFKGLYRGMAVRLFRCLLGYRSRGVAILLNTWITRAQVSHADYFLTVLQAPLAGITPIFAVCFAAYGAAKEGIAQLRGLPAGASLSLNDIGIAGALSAVPTTLIMAPGERLKVVLQTQGSGGAFRGPVDVAKHLVRTQGVTSLFRGSAATLARDGAGSYAYFGVYEWLKRSLTPSGETLSPIAIISAGGFAGVANWLVSLPLDTIKSRIQAQVVAAAPAAGGSTPAATVAARSPSMLSVGAALVRAEGVSSLYRGLAPALMRAFPANAACFLGMEASKKYVLDPLLGGR